MRPIKGHSKGQRSSYIRWRLKGIILFTERKAYSPQVTLEGSTRTMLQSQPFAPEQQIPTQLICDLPDYQSASAAEPHAKNSHSHS